MPEAPKPTAQPPFSLAVDAMGGDHAPESVLDGLEFAAETTSRPS